ncbi:hypothetical protein [Rhodospirillum centenum]|uniref:Uncharacterized protein n=1 Tax=Rhodospirillum centenum (strain ATCC 51521 / SW) TaxID=414684 RepID=B6IWK2_RHOCS|nr:hypothetical protein [Rhodospirillum centenum]ACJ00676.1 hypothetical protein RC1_3315 [Rhodospirillum centenum SW]
MPHPPGPAPALPSPAASEALLDALFLAYDGPPPRAARLAAAAGGQPIWRIADRAAMRERAARECAAMRLACARRRAALTAAAATGDIWLARVAARLSACRADAEEGRTAAARNGSRPPEERD